MMSPVRHRPGRAERGGIGYSRVVELELRIRVPLVGGRPERLPAERIITGLDAEHEVGVAHLEGKR
jgi:hypothetical protein